jgi:N-acyl-D-aspartate/D-glutamate deacylase
MYAMGDASWQRAATDAEIAEMKSLAHEALEAGAVGFTTTNSPQHVGAFGLPVPSRFSTVEEIEGIADVLRVTGRGVLQGTLGPEMTVAAFNQIARTSERPVLWSAILAKRDDHNYVPQLLEAFERYGRNTTPQFACKPIVTQISLREPSTLGNIPAFQTMLGVPANERKTMYRDRRWRDEAKQGARALWGDRLDRAIVRETRAATELLHAGPLTELAPAGIDPIDFLFDIAVADDLETRFEITMINDDDDQITGLLRDNRLILSLSDAGAHASQLCDADYSSHLLGHWCRERAALPLELAIWRLTAHPAATFGLTDRGLLREGYVADLVAFDPNTVAGDMLERIYDFPRGTDRLVSRSHGISDVWVAGRQIRRRGTPIAGAHPGALLRSSDPPNTLQ